MKTTTFSIKRNEQKTVYFSLKEYERINQFAKQANLTVTGFCRNEISSLAIDFYTKYLVEENLKEKEYFSAPVFEFMKIQIKNSQEVKKNKNNLKRDIRDKAVTIYFSKSEKNQLDIFLNFVKTHFLVELGFEKISFGDIVRPIILLAIDEDNTNYIEAIENEIERLKKILDGIKNNNKK